MLGRVPAMRPLRMSMALSRGKSGIENRRSVQSSRWAEEEGRLGTDATFGIMAWNEFLEIES